MDDPHKLRRGGGNKPRSREGAPQVRCIYRQGRLLTPEVLSSAVRLNRSSQPAKEGGYGSIAKRFASLSLSSSREPPRKGVSGSKGDAQSDCVSPQTNLLELGFHKNLVLYDYTVMVEPGLHNVDKDTRHELFCLFENSKEIAPFLHGIVHDGAQRLISNRLLPPNLVSIVRYYEDIGGMEVEAVMSEYTFRLRGPEALRFEDLFRHLASDYPQFCPQPLLSAFNLILTSSAVRVNSVVKRRHFLFMPPNELDPRYNVAIGAKLESWKGFAATVTPVNGHLVVAVSTKTSAFHAPNTSLSDAMIAYTRHGFNMKDVNSFYYHVKVVTTYLGYCRRRTIKGFGTWSARRTLVQVENLGEELTVEQYFKLRFGISLDHPDDLPVVNLGTNDRDLFVPAEVCTILTGQRCSGPLPKVCASILSESAKNASKGLIQDDSQGMRVLGLDLNSELVTNFGLNLSRATDIVSSRALNSSLLYRLDYPGTINSLQLTRSVHFHRAAQLRTPVVLVIHVEDTESIVDVEMRWRETVMDFFAKCRSFGMRLDTSLPMLHSVVIPRKSITDPSREAALHIIEQKLIAVSKFTGFVLFALPEKDSRIYSGIKLACDIKLGLRCLCLSAPKFYQSKEPDKYLSNLAWKLNHRLGGVNYEPHPDSMKWLKDTMLAGISLMNPFPELREGAFAIAAIVASRDRDFVHHPASFSIQKYGKGIITDTKQMMKNRLDEYRKNFGVLPKHIIIFRKGISDGQIKEVLDIEVSALRDACHEFECKPKLTVVICSKRHRCRLYSTERKCDTGSKNTQSASINVVNIGENGTYGQSFFLKAHSGVQNIAHPTRYTVILDENKYSDLQQVVGNICRLFPLSPRAVSMAPPVYWADRACRMARSHLRHFLDQRTFDALGKEVMEGKVEQLWTENVEDKITGNNLFYV